MVASFSPHRDTGGTLHLSSTSFHSAHKTSAISQLRRSLSRSPSKSTDFRLLSPSAFNSRTSSILSPAALSPSRRLTHGKLLFVPHSTPQQSQVAIPFPPSAKIQRPIMRRNRTFQSSRISSTPTPVKRILGESRDQGNSVASDYTPTIMKSKVTTPPNSRLFHLDHDESPIFPPASETLEDASASPRVEKRRSGDLEVAPSSPLKRGDLSLSLDFSGAESPSAKRRSTNFGPEFDIFNPSQSASPSLRRSPSNGKEARTQGHAPIPNHFSTIPRRSSSLRKSTIQQRLPDRFFIPRSKFSSSAQHDFTPGPGPKFPPPRQRMSLDGSTFRLPDGDSPTVSNIFPSSSTPLFASRKETSFRSPLHPLSRTLTQSSSGSSLVDDSPTHRPFHFPPPESKPILNFSKSLPIGYNPKNAFPQGDSSTPDSSFATPENYKLVKPLPSAFLSTGLISKKNKNVNAMHGNSTSHQMPDTPCKRVSNIIFGGNPFPQTANVNNPPRDFKSTTPFFHHPDASTNLDDRENNFSPTQITSRSHHAGFGSHPPLPSTSFDFQSQLDSELPPTPTKNGSLLQSGLDRSFHFDEHDPSADQADSISSPLFAKLVKARDSQTPNGHPLTSGRNDFSIPAQNSFMESYSSTLPATPTAHRESYPTMLKRSSFPMGSYKSPDVDSSLTSRFEKVELVGTGEFSLVYCVTERPPLNRQEHSLFSTPMTLTARNSNPSVWAVKKSKQPFTGAKDRQRRNNEVEVLRSLRNSDHIISFQDSWEENGYLYIQTEFCEEGSLDVFLSQAGLKARLDDFRIWKILLELSHGLKQIHESGFIHLDLKPANILITFEGVLKIADFGLAARWPAASGIEGEGDREYIGPEVLMGQFDKPADIFALGLIIFETAGNVELPDNGVSWQKLRNGDMSDILSLTWSRENSNIQRDASGNPVANSSTPLGDISIFDECEKNDSPGKMSSSFFQLTPHKNQQPPSARSGELLEPPTFMTDASHDDALDKMVRWMISPNPSDRPVADQILQSCGVQWVEQRRRAGATIYEGNWGPADDILNEDSEMMDV
ncbi:hypothetical protein FQN57_002773 [Myotisia sp. PD_48]|nr:hypothetical protein FQN57_002773 [Myotisia sp. PD_48]